MHAYMYVHMYTHIRANSPAYAVCVLTHTYIQTMSHVLVYYTRAPKCERLYMNGYVLT